MTEENQNIENTGEEEGSAAESQGSEQGSQEQTVPVGVVQEIRNELKEMKQANQTLQDQVALYQANTGQRQQETPQNQPEGPADDDLMTHGEFKNLLNAEASKISGAIGEIRMMQENSDYTTIIKEHLPNVLKNSPALQQAIRTSSNPYVLAYSLGKTDPAYIKKVNEQNLNKGGNASQQQADAQKIIDNAQKPGSASLASGAGGGISGASLYENMTDDQIRARAEEVKRRG